MIKIGHILNQILHMEVNSSEYGQMCLPNFNCAWAHVPTSRTFWRSAETAKATHVAHFTWDDIERQTGLKITTIIFDCEGCMFPILNTYRHKFSQIQKVIIENDNHQGPNCDSECQEANRFFEDSGFVLHDAFLSNLQANYVYVRQDAL